MIVPLHENRNQYLKKAQANYLHDHQDEPKLDLTKIVVCYRPKQRLFRYGVVTPITPAPGQGGAAKTSKVAPEFNLQTVKIVANSVRSSLATLTVPQLKTLCRQTNIQVTAKMVKQDYLDLLVPMLTIKNQHLAVIT